MIDGEAARRVSKACLMTNSMAHRAVACPADTCARRRIAPIRVRVEAMSARGEAIAICVEVTPCWAPLVRLPAPRRAELAPGPNTEVLRAPYPPSEVSRGGLCAAGHGTPVMSAAPMES